MGRASWNRYQTWICCKWKYYLRYVKGIDIRSNWRTYVVGSTVARCMERWGREGFDTKLLTPAFVLEELKGVLDGQQGLRGTETRAWWENAVKGVYGAAWAYSKYDLKSAVVEFQLQDVIIASNPRHKISGAMDLWVRSEEKILDVKMYTGSDSADYRQNLLYSVGAYNLGESVKEVGFIYPVRPEEARIEVRPVPLALIHAVEQDVVEFLDLVSIPEEVDWVCEVGDHCWWCEFNRTQFCPATGGELKVVKVEGTPLYQAEWSRG